MSEQKSEPISGKTGSVGTGPAASGMPAPSAPVTAFADATAEAQPPRLASEQEETSPGPDAASVEAPKVEASKVEAPKVEAPKPEVSRSPGKVLIMSPADRARNGGNTSSRAERSGKRRGASAMVAVAALATVAGALGGALATAGLRYEGLGHFVVGDAAAAKDSTLAVAVARIDANILALTASVEKTANTGANQFSTISDRLDKVERAQAEPAAKLARLSDAVDKLRAAPPPAPAAVAAAPVAAR
ncbi:MAG: hypothetical protein WCE35_18370, partial [Bradyrhizobium sp.]